ncbi:outer membrane protein transport protein [Yoonia sp.]|nr:outer membrane protein transport protein [Yoonia sp.]
MKKVLTAGAALLLTTSIAQAGGLDRSGQGVGIIFEEGNVVQLSFGYVTPEVTGETAFELPGAFPLGASSGNMAEDYLQFGGGIKYAYNDRVDLALIFDQPFGANVSYSGADAGYYTGAVAAEVSSSAITAIGRYKVDDNFSVHGGLRLQTVQATVEKPFPFQYKIESEDSTGVGFVLGAAYEIPAIALRVAVTYNSKIKHDIKASESCVVVDPATLFAPPPTVVYTCNAASQTTELETPESINVDFQTGIAEDTLLFGSVRYAKWTQFNFAPPEHLIAFQGDSLQSYDEDTFAYTLGLGRRFSDTFSGAISVGYEAEQGGFSGNFAPTDGNLSLGVGGTYTAADYEVTAGIRYIMLGDADTEAPGLSPALIGEVGAEFRDNTAIGFGMQISRSF